LSVVISDLLFGLIKQIEITIRAHMQCTEWPKTGTLCLVRLNFVKYWPNFKFISLSESKHL